MLSPKIRRLEQNNRFIRSLFYILRKTNTSFQNLKFEVKARLRVLGFEDKNYVKIKNPKVFYYYSSL